MEVGEEDEALAEVAVLLFDGLLDLDDHVGEAPDVVSGADDLGAGGLVVVVGEGGEGSGVVLDEDGVAGFDEGFDACGGDADAAFVVFDFLGDADDHVFPLCARRAEGVGARAPASISIVSGGVAGWMMGRCCLPGRAWDDEGVAGTPYREFGP